MGSLKNSNIFPYLWSSNKLDFTKNYITVTVARFSHSSIQTLWFLTSDNEIKVQVFFFFSVWLCRAVCVLVCVSVCACVCVCYHSEGWCPRRWRKRTSLPASKTCRANWDVLLVYPSAGTRWSRCRRWGWTHQYWQTTSQWPNKESNQQKGS